MEKCPFCGAETRPGDNFCLHCGNRLPQMTPSSVPSQAQQAIGVGETTVASPDEWGSPAPSIPSSPVSWSEASTGAGNGADLPTMRADAPSASIQGPTGEQIEEPGKLILRAEGGETIKEYPLDKQEISIGRAPNSDILLSKDKLTSRRHATVRYENGNYVLRDERSANGTFVNGQQVEEMVSRVLQDGDHIGIGEHELIFRSPTPASDVDKLPTVLVPFEQPPLESTYRTKPGEEPTVNVANNEFDTRSMAENDLAAQVAQPRSGSNGSAASTPVTPPPATPVAPAPVVPSYTPPSTPAPTPVAAATPVAAPAAKDPTPPATASTGAASTPATTDTSVTFNRFNNISNPALPELTDLTAALTALDGQVNSLREQFNETQEAMKNHEAEVSNTANQLRTGVRRVSDRMDSTIAEVARSRELLAWAELMQLLEDVMNNPRDIDYVSRLARKAKELNKVFQLHQSVLNTMAECNSLLRSMIGEDR